jgi:hypothetical protein
MWVVCGPDGAEHGRERLLSDANLAAHRLGTGSSVYLSADGETLSQRVYVVDASSTETSDTADSTQPSSGGRWAAVMHVEVDRYVKAFLTAALLVAIAAVIGLSNDDYGSGPAEDQQSREDTEVFCAAYKLTITSNGEVSASDTARFQRDC